MAKSPKTKKEDGTEILKGPPEKPKRKRGRPAKHIEHIPDTPENVARAVVRVPRDLVSRPK